MFDKFLKWLPVAEFSSYAFGTVFSLEFLVLLETPKSLAISSSSTLFDRPHLNSISDSILWVETLKSREELCFSSSWELIWPMFWNGGKKVFHKCLICNCRWRVEVRSTVTPSDVCFRVCLACATRTKYSSKLPPTSRSIVCRSKYHHHQRSCFE